MPTTAQLTERVMKRIGALDPNESPTFQEHTDVLAIMNSVYETEKELGRFNWTLTSIPTRYQEWFITYVGWFVQPHFGMSRVTPDDFMLARRKLAALNERKVDPRSNPVVDF